MGLRTGAILKAVLVGVAVIGAVGCAHAHWRPADGTYGNVSMSPTGHLGGFEMELSVTGPAPSVVFAECAGGCWGGKRWPARIAGPVVSFTVVDEVFEEGGRRIELPPVRFEARLTSAGARLSSPDRPDVKDLRLRRLWNAKPGGTEALADMGPL